MNNSQCRFQNGMDLLATMLAVGYLNGVFKPTISPVLEKRLGRKPTDWDWQVCLEEISKKGEFEAQQKILKAQQAQTNDRKIIHDFVWKEGE